MLLNERGDGGCVLAVGQRDGIDSADQIGRVPFDGGLSLRNRCLPDLAAKDVVDREVESVGSLFRVPVDGRLAVCGLRKHLKLPRVFVQ